MDGHGGTLAGLFVSSLQASFRAPELWVLPFAQLANVQKLAMLSCAEFISGVIVVAGFLMRTALLPLVPFREV